MGREFDPDEIRTVADAVDGMASGFTTTSDGVTGTPGGTAFGNLPNSSAMSSAVDTFVDNVQSELSAGKSAVESTAGAITSAANGMDGDEDDTVRSFGGDPGVRYV